VFVGLGLVLSIVAGGAAFFLASQDSTKAAEVPMKTVVVATQQIDARTIIASDMLVERSVPDDPTVEQAVVSVSTYSSRHRSMSLCRTPKGSS
jgi:hypothetical protein